VIREERVALDDTTDGATAAMLTLARPEKKNALSAAMISALVDAVTRANADDRVRAIVLAADGDVFAAGGDLDEIAAALASPDGASEIVAVGARLGVFEEVDVPVLLAMSGDVYGGGCELTLLADIVVVEEHARLSFRHARMGLAPAWGGTARLVERVGPTVAARMLFTAERIDAGTAERTGLVTEAVASGKSAERCVGIAREIAKAARSTIAAQKRGLLRARAAIRSAAEASAAEADVFRSLFGGPAHIAAMKSMGRG
jgi:enoyl-CoA hydratase/carnithine racemase